MVTGYHSMLSRYFSLVLEDRNCLVVSRNFSGGSWHLSALSVVLVPPESHRDFRIAGGLRSLSIYTDGLESLGSLLIYAGSTILAPILAFFFSPNLLLRQPLPFFFSAVLHHISAGSSLFRLSTNSYIFR